MTADGSDDNVIQPEHTQNYSFAEVEVKAALNAMELGADGEERKLENVDDDDNDDKLSDSEADEFESDDEPDEESKVKSLTDALPADWEVSEDQPALDDSLVGKSILFKWNIGWSRGVVTLRRKGKKAAKFNFEVTYEPDVIYPHMLDLERYRTRDDCEIGGWCVIVEK